MSDFDEIWHADAYWPPAPDRPLKLRIFKNRRWLYSTETSTKNSTETYLQNYRVLQTTRKIWHADTYWPPPPDRQLKLRIFENPRWRTAAILKIEKIAISQQPLDRF